MLIVVPASLAAQWADELARRFSIQTVAADAAKIDRLSREDGRGDNAWSRRGVWIASVDFLKQPHVISALPDAPWDLVVFDEAHTLCGESRRYDAAAAIGARTRALLLLTATPHTGDTARFERLLALGSIPDSLELVAFRRRRADLGVSRTRRIRWRAVTPAAAERDVLDTLQNFERVVLRASRPADNTDVADATILLLAVFRKRALSSMHALDVSLRRRLAWIERVPGDPEPAWHQTRLFDADASEIADDDTQFLTARIGLGRSHERLWLCRLIRLTGEALVNESKMRALRTLLRRTAEPVVIFTEFRHTLERLAQELRDVRALASLHGGQTPDSQHASLGDFVDGRATVLLATDVASQGLNMHTRARWVICFDLPWSPARLEQRIGRVDRLGQNRAVHATLVIRRHPAEDDVLVRMSTRALAADAATHARAFGDWDITEDLVRRRVIGGDHGAKPPAPAPRSLPLSSSWQRIARAAARHLERRRRFRPTHPRHVDLASCAFVARVDRLGAISRLSTGDVGVYSVPLLNGAGDLVEHRVVAIDFGHAGVDNAWLHDHRDRLERVIAASVQARLRRLGRWLRSRAEVLAATEHALQEFHARRPTLSQAGLFDRQAAAQAAMRRTAATELDRVALARVDEHFASFVIHLGRPVLELLLARRV